MSVPLELLGGTTMRSGHVAAGLALASAIGTATAQDVPNLRGAWVEERGGVVRRGQLEHQPSTGGELVFGGPLTWTLTVERQEGVVFSGTWASQNRTDPIVGAISANGRSLYLADDNGPMHGDLRGPDELEICRTLADADTMLATCRLFRRRR
jgi:hypothetical protein